MTNFSPEYTAHMQSFAWAVYRQRVLKLWRWRGCVICGNKKRLEVHHLTYERLGHERLLDCVPLCHECHAWVTWASRMWRELWK